MFQVAITRGYMFRPQHLGGNWPTSDFYVELNGLDERLFFIVQVKSSIRGYDRGGNLRIQVPKSKVIQLRNYFAPTYLAGVDIPGEKVCLTAINFVATKDVTKISSTFEVNEQTLKLLYGEVQHFWQQSGLKTYKSGLKTYKEQYKHVMV